MARLNVKYKEEIAPSLMQKFQYKSVMQIPRIDKIVVSVGCGDCKTLLYWNFCIRAGATSSLYFFFSLAT